METVFNNVLQQKSFDQKGYVVVKQLVDETSLHKLLALFEKHEKRFEGAFHTSHFSSDVAYKREVHNVITQVVFEKIKPLLNSYIPIFGNFMIKNPAPNVSTDLHADWTYVDETKHTSLAIWIPLIDTTIQNGCLGIIEGSHKVTNLLRGPLIRQSSRDRDHLWAQKFGKLLPMRAGDAIVYSHRLLHYSKPNQTDKVRPAVNLSLVPSNAKIIHYCMPEGVDRILLYDVPNTDFYLNYTHFQTPQTNSLIKTLPKDTVKYIDPIMEKYKGITRLDRLKNWIASLS